MKIAIIGGGAAGLACAAELIRSEKRFGLTIFEKNDRIGKKILSTGNGRCNIFNENRRPYVSISGNLPSEKLPVRDNRDFFEYVGVPVFSDEEGRCYPLSNRASSVLDSFLYVLNDTRVKTEVNKNIKTVSKKDKRFFVEGESYDFLVLAVGGKAQVKDWCGDSLAKALGHSFTLTSPALVKLETTSRVVKSLNGVRSKADVSLFVDNDLVARENGEVQFSSDSLSGICIMQLSLLASRLLLNGRSCRVEMNFIPSVEPEECRRVIDNVRKNLPNAPAELLFSGMINKTLVREILKTAEVDIKKKCREVTPDEIEKAISIATGMSFDIKATRGYRDAQVMLGGINNDEIQFDTMESKIHHNLYICGEMLDVTGFCGGYNLNWAWSSGRTAARDILQKL